MTDLREFDAANYLEIPEDIEIFLEDAFETGNYKYISSAIGAVIRARGVADIAKSTGLNRQQLYRSFSEDGNPRIDTLLKVMSSLSISLAPKHLT
jgi:probable addiction module antidote protein